MSGGTMASTVGALAAQSFGFRDGRVRTERGAKRVRGFDVDGSKRDGVSVGSLRALRPAAGRARSCAR